MKKVFPLTSPTHQPPQVVASIKNDVRKYLKRERRKALPESVDFWDFNCRVGFNSDEPQTKHVEEIVPAIDQAVAQQCDSIFIEILATPGHRTSKPKTTDSQGPDA